MSILFSVSVAMLGGLLMTRLTRLLHLPNVTAYLLAGVLVGPYVFGLLNSETVASLGIITKAALGFIAFSIGDQFELSALKKIGKPALLITVFESLGAVCMTMIITKLCGFDPVICLMLGALSASTAPAATLLIIKQYKASGPLTNMLLPVVAADDATGLIAYSICVTLAQNIIEGNAFSFSNSVLIPLMDVVLALLIGALIGFLLALSHRFFLSHTNRMSLVIACILFGVGLASYYGLSDLLLCMAMGAVYVNLRNDSGRILNCIDDWTYPMFMLFFVISGATLNLQTLGKVGILGIIYVCARFAGKYAGSFLGASLSKQPPVVRNNIGWALMPQAGVAIGMATMALQQLPSEYGTQIQTVILAATLIYEIVGPLASKSALKRAGELHIS